MISPFWFDVMMEAVICVLAIVFGIAFSSQIRSIRFDAMFWLIVRLLTGNRRWIIDGKYPSSVVNLCVGVGDLCLSVEVMLFRSMATVNPKIEIVMAINFSDSGIVIVGILVGGRFEVIINPARILPRARRLIGLIS